MKTIDRGLRAGDWVEVRSKEEILRTLDDNGRLDGMPFMPEMLAFCGRRFRVYKRAHKTCDTVFPVRGRRVPRAVHLDTRCDGQAHGGCQAACLLFWKDAWLKPISGEDLATTLPARVALSDSEATGPSDPVCSEGTLWKCAAEYRDGTIIYRCQATQLPYMTTPLAWWDIRQYIEDYRSGNIDIRRLLSGMAYSACYNLSQAGIGLGPAIRWVYDKIHLLWGGPKFPHKVGTIPEQQPTPTVTLQLRPGELVRIKAHEDILRTITVANKNRGLLFDDEMVPFCGGTYKVLKRVTNIVDERTGKMLHMTTPCIILDKVFCRSRYSSCRMFCPRSIYAYWREIWLERVESTRSHSTEANSSSEDTCSPAKAEGDERDEHVRPETPSGL